MSINPSEVPPRNTWGIIVLVVIGFAISLSAVLITLLAALMSWNPRIGILGQFGIIGVFFCLPNIRDGQGWAKKLSILGVIFGFGAAGVGYVWYVLITGDTDLCG